MNLKAHTMKGQEMINPLRQAARIAIFAVVFLPALPSTQTKAAAQAETEGSGLRLYDNFNSSAIDTTRWFTGSSCNDPATMECVRQIEDARLHLRVRTYGDRTSNAGTGFGHVELFLSDTAITDVATDLTVLDVNTSACVTSPGAGTHGHTVLYGSWFNDGSGLASGDAQAYVAADRTSEYPLNQVQVGAFIQYQNAILSFVNVGSFNVGERVRLELKWDKAHHRFLASLRRYVNNSTVTMVVPYILSDTVPAVFPNKAIGVRAFPENCTGMPTFVDLETEFDRVLVN
jgi:hypothetical protein